MSRQTAQPRNKNNTPSVFISRLTLPIAAADLQRIADIEARCFGENDNHPIFSPGLTIGNPEKFNCYFNEPEGCTLYVAYKETEGKKNIIAYMVTVPPSNNEKEGKALGHCLSNFGVDPDFQGQGIGLMFVLYFFNEVYNLEKEKPLSAIPGLSNVAFKERSMIYLHVRTANPAENLYKSCGFKRTMKREAYYKSSKICEFKDKALLDEYKKIHVDKPNKTTLAYYKKHMKPHHVAAPRYVFSLRMTQDNNTGYIKTQLVADAYRMQITYGAAKKQLKKKSSLLKKVAYKAYQEAPLPSQTTATDTSLSWLKKKFGGM